MKIVVLFLYEDRFGPTWNHFIGLFATKKSANKWIKKHPIRQTNAERHCNVWRYKIRTYKIKNGGKNV